MKIFLIYFLVTKWKFISMRKKPVQQVKRQAAEQKHLITKAKDMHIWRMQLSESQQIFTVLRSHEVLFNYDVAFHSKRVKCMFVYDFQINIISGHSKSRKTSKKENIKSWCSFLKQWKNSIIQWIDKLKTF